MIKLIDDNMGKLLTFLQESKLHNNTIVIFTSDHGDLMGEHARDNKGNPYKTSAGVPLIIRWPNRIARGKVVKSAYSSVDFAPTLLSMLGVNTTEYNFQGIDASKDLFDQDLVISNETQVRYTEDSFSPNWAAALTQRYKFILSHQDIPWLIDMEDDPDEIINFYGREGYDDVSTTMKQALHNAIMTYDLTLQQGYVMFDIPTCSETNDQLDGKRIHKTCEDFSSTGDFTDRCKWPKDQKLCPVSCELCTDDSNGYILFNNTLLTCSDVGHDQCAKSYLSLNQFCPKSCRRRPPCQDAHTKFVFEQTSNKSCNYIGQDPSNKCQVEDAMEMCPVTCKVHCSCYDTVDDFLYKGKNRNCNWVANQSARRCVKWRLLSHCPKVCNQC